MHKVVTATALVAALAGAGCTTTEQGAGLGGLYGASTGAAIGALATGRASGALAGAAIGGATGAMVGAATAAPAGYPAGVYAAPGPVVVAAPVVVGPRTRVVRRTVVYR
jgi:hypothetical protein